MTSVAPTGVAEPGRLSEAAELSVAVGVHRAERWYHGSSVLAYLAHAMAGFAMVTWVHDTTGDSRLAGVAVGALLAPLLVLGLWAGSLADRVSRQRIVVRAQLVSVAAGLGLGAVSLGSVAPPAALVVAIAAVYGVGMAFIPQTRLALLAHVTTPDRLGQATVTVSMLNTVALAAGPFLVGQITHLTSWPTAFLTIAACWALSTVLATRTPTVTASLTPPPDSAAFDEPVGPRTSTRPPSTRRGRGTVTEIARYLRGDAVVRALLGMVAASILLLFGPLQVLVPAFAGEILGLDDGQRGTLMGVLGLGIVAGGAAATRATRLRHLPRWLVATAVVAVGLPIALAAATTTATAAIVLLAVGATAGFFASVAPGIVQVAVTDEIRGRIMAAYVVVRWGLPALGAAAAGLLAETLGLRPTFVVYGLAGTTLVLTTGRRFLRSWSAVAVPPAEEDDADGGVDLRPA
jgi:MFS family permease